MFHGQIYDFKYHRAKTDCILEDTFRHYKFSPLREFLELVTAECPHSVFKETERRASEYKDIFNLDKVKIIPRNNFAVRNTRLVMQAVDNNKLRHNVLEEFMLLNDSVTVATEVPVLMDEDDIRHYQNELGFEVPEAFARPGLAEQGQALITGHIDLLQIRNGAIHILDYKPSARKAKPVDQLTLYALALARLTGLRLFHFKCAWFDEEDYFEFFPLHVVYKKKKKGRKKRSMVK
jgi:ATP-dependent exoDNAse (exonuclease V) beta subunit